MTLTFAWDFPTQAASTAVHLPASARMKPSIALLHHRCRIRELAASHRAANPRVFGSVLHGKDVDGSDIDILVDPLPGATLFDLGSLQVDLEELLGVPVDLLTPANLPQRIRAEVLSQAQPI